MTTRLYAGKMPTLLTHRGMRCARCGDATVNHVCGHCGVTWHEGLGWLENATSVLTHPSVGVLEPGQEDTAP